MTAFTSSLRALADLMESDTRISEPNVDKWGVYFFPTTVDEVVAIVDALRTEWSRGSNSSDVVLNAVDDVLGFGRVQIFPFKKIAGDVLVFIESNRALGQLILEDVATVGVLS
ncbi:hypothetical protein BH09ACT9_BH09ACT9_00020 [soil metagenome]